MIDSRAAVAGETGKTDAVHHLCYGPLAPGSCVKKPAALVWVKVELLDGDHRGPLAIGRFDRAAILALAAEMMTLQLRRLAGLRAEVRRGHSEFARATSWLSGHGSGTSC